MDYNIHVLRGVDMDYNIHVLRGRTWIIIYMY